MDNIHVSDPCGLTEYTAPTSGKKSDSTAHNEVRNKTCSLKCTQKKCSRAKYQMEYCMSKLPPTLAVTFERIVVPHPLKAGDLNQFGDMLEEDDNSTQLRPKFWISDINEIGELIVDGKKHRLRLTAMILRTSNHSNDDGHFITTVRKSGDLIQPKNRREVNSNNMDEDELKWRTYDDLEIKDGLPFKNEYFPLIMFFSEA